MARDHLPKEPIKASHINVITPDEGEIIVGGPDLPVRRPITDFDNSVPLAAVDSVAAEVAYTNPGAAGTSGKALIQGPSSPKWGDMGTVVFDHVFERSTTPATNRANLQTLLDRVAPGGSGKQVRLYIPPRFDGSGNPDPIVIDRDGANAWAILVPSNVSIEGAGAGSVIGLASGVANFTRILSVGNETAGGVENVTIRNLTIDGNETGNDPTYEHNHNIFVWSGTNVLIEDVTTINATGDGVCVSGGAVPSERVWIDRLTAHGHKRNPVTANEVNHIWITGSDLICSSTGQAIDSEPDAAVATTGLYVAGCRLSNTAGGYAASLAGNSAANRRTDTRFIGNHIDAGRIWAVYTDNLVIVDNTGTSGVYAINDNTGGVVRGNVWDTASDFAVDVQSSGTAYATGWTITGNQLAGGVRLLDVRDAIVSDNMLTGSGTAGVAGVKVEANLRELRDTAIRGNLIRNFAHGVEGGGAFTHNGLAIVGNTFDTISGCGIQLWGENKYSNLVISDNIPKSVTTWANLAWETYYVMAGTPGAGAVWNCRATPEGQIADVIGAVAYRRDGGAGATMYVKESGTGNTGWVAK